MKQKQVKRKRRLILFMVLIILVGSFSFVATKIEGRSSRSKLAELILWIVRDQTDDVDAAVKYLEEASAKNEEPYKLPSDLLVGTSFRIEEQTGMQVVMADPDPEAPRHLILYLHGGAYVSPPSIAHWSFLDKLALGTGAAIAAPLYPRAPNHSFLEAYDKLTSFYRDLMDIYEAREIIFIGDSAGGGLALGLAETLEAEGLPQPGQIILISPWLDLTMENPDLIDYEDVDPMLKVNRLDRIADAWADGTNRRDPRLSPLFGSLNNLAEITLFVGTHELFLPEARLLRDKAVDSFVTLNYYEYERMNHIFPLYPIPEAGDAQAKIIEQIMKN